MIVQLLLLVIVAVDQQLLLTLVASASEETCYAHNTHPYLNFSSKTAYEFVYNKDGIPPPLPECRAVQLWMLCRHGTRWPGRKQFPAFRRLHHIRDRIIANYDAKRTILCEADMENLRKFEFAVDMKEANLLTEQGRQEMRRLGRRLSARFPHLFDAPYSPGKYIVLHDETTRTRESALAFAEGAFGLDINSTLPDTNDTVIRLIHPYKKCRGWLDAQKESEMQQQRFDETPHMQSVVGRVGARLGFDREQHPLTLDDVMAVYEGCRYQKAWQPDRTSAWCAAFTAQDLQVLEYRKDMSEWYRSGAASPTGLRLACPLLKDMVDNSFRSGADGGSRVLLYFSHDTMVRMLAARLGLADGDTPIPTPYNMAEQTNRKWRISLLAPFAANIIAVLYNCSSGPSVALYVQERPVVLPGCGGVLCDLRKLDALFGEMVREPACMDLSFCGADSSALPLPPPTAWGPVIVALTLVCVATAFRYRFFNNR